MTWKCPDGAVPTTTREIVAALIVLPLLAAGSVYIGVYGARGIRRRRLVLSRDGLHTLEGRAAVVWGGVIVALALVNAVLFAALVSCNL